MSYAQVEKTTAFIISSCQQIYIGINVISTKAAVTLSLSPGGLSNWGTSHCHCHNGDRHTVILTLENITLSRLGLSHCPCHCHTWRLHTVTVTLSLSNCPSHCHTPYSYIVNVTRLSPLLSFPNPQSHFHSQTFIVTLSQLNFYCHTFTVKLFPSQKYGVTIGPLK